MKFKKALVDFSILLLTIMPVLSIILAYYFAFQSITKPLTKMIEENSKQVILVMPSKMGCKVSVIRQG